MKVKVSKTFAAYINKAAKELGFKVEASVVTMSGRAYKMNVSMDLYEAEGTGDYDYVEDEAKAIRVEYPAEYYAMPKYITTAELNREYRRRRVETEQELKEMLREMCEV